MIRFSRGLIILAALAGLAISAAGCGGGDDEEIEIVIWEQKDPEEQILLQRHIAKFMAEHPGVTVTTDHFETDVLHSQFQTAALAGGGPDLVYGPADKVGPYSVMQLIRPLDDVFGRAFFEGFEEGSVPSLDGHIYAIPDQVGNHLMLIYNKALVDRAPADSDEWIRMAKELTVDTDGNGIPDRYGIVFNFMEPFWLAPFLGGFGGRMMDDAYRPTLDTPAMAGALRFLADMRNRHEVLPREANYPVSDTMFKNGQAAFLINGPWSLKAYIKAGIDIGVAPIPMITETKRYPSPMVSSKGYSININVPFEKIAIVKDLIIHLTSAPVQKDITHELFILPSVTSLYGDEELFENEVLRGSMEQARLGTSMPNVPEMRAVWDAIRPFYQSVLGGQLDPEDAARRMQERAVKKIAEMKE